MGKYIEDSKELLQLVGGKENITAVSHCMTRMRFVLTDPAKADVPGIEAMKVVKGTFTQSGQFQVIIGQEVQEFYNDFTAVSGIEGVSKEQVKKQAREQVKNHGKDRVRKQGKPSASPCSGNISSTMLRWP
jgi:PTS system trehalose-specific IIC component